MRDEEVKTQFGQFVLQLPWLRGRAGNSTASDRKSHATSAQCSYPFSQADLADCEEHRDIWFHKSSSDRCGRWYPCRTRKSGSRKTARHDGGTNDRTRCPQ